MSFAQGLNPGLAPQQNSAPPAIGHLLAAGRELSLNSAQRPESAGASGAHQQGGKPFVSRRGSGFTEQHSDASMWSRRSSNTVADAGLFLPPGAAASMAAAAAAADSSLWTASVAAPARDAAPPVAIERSSAADASPLQRAPAPKLKPLQQDSATPVQGHYGAMRKAGTADGSTYLHTQLMQVSAPDLLPSWKDDAWYCCIVSLSLHSANIKQVLHLPCTHSATETTIGLHWQQAHAAANAQGASAKQAASPPPGAARPAAGTTAQQKAEWAAIVQKAAAAAGIRSALQVCWSMEHQQAVGITTRFKAGMEPRLPLLRCIPAYWVTQHVES